MSTSHIDTSKRGVDWYVKWVATALVLTSVAFRAAGPEYRELDIVVGFAATVAWLWVSIAWKDRALILVNAVMGCILASSMIDFIL